MKSIVFKAILIIALAIVTTNSQVLQWAYTHTNVNWNYNIPNDMTVDNSGNVYVTGRKYGATYNDYFTHMISPAGSLLWAVTFNGLQNVDDQSNAIAVDNNGNVYVTGSSRDTSANYMDITTIKYSSAGTEVWRKSFNGPGHFDDIGKKIAVDNNGNIIVAGTSYGIGTLTDYVILKYTSSGTLIWQARYNGIANSYDELADMKLDASGDVIVTGTSIGTGTGQDYATARFNGFNGSQIWESRYNNPETGMNPDEAAALAISPNGDVIVTGKSNSTNGGWDFLTQKYSGSNGVQQWTKRYNGTANGWDQPMGICCDKNNNTFVTGMTYVSGNYNSNTVLIKYSQAGSENWTKFHLETPNTNEYPKAITVDSSGNPYLTIMPNGENYISNIKFSGSTGNIMWQHNYNTGGYTDPVDIIVDANYSIYVCGQNGSRTTTLKYTQLVGVNNNQNNIAKDFSLEQNFPNPFNPSTTISFSIAKESKVKMTIFDITGKIIEVLLNEKKNAGRYEIVFNGSDLSSGTYFYKIETDGFTDVKKMILVK